ncbi:MAG: XRE family transcriptional regulator [Clostridia bacterium]|nr:XRE family transcriptional regulator [Clostridia bacterium]
MKTMDNIYEIIADNIRLERKRLGITQAQLAEEADLSIDTIKSVESGRRAMTLDTYLKLVRALDTTPFSFIVDMKDGKHHIEQFMFMTRERSSKEVEFVLHMVEQILKGQDSYLK